MKLRSKSFFIMILTLTSAAALTTPSNSRTNKFRCGKSFVRKPLSRRESMLPFLIAAVSSVTSPSYANAEDTPAAPATYSFETRNRNKNKNALVRDDIWYFSGQIPPRKIDLDNLPAGPKWNAWGTCAESASGNSCTYVSYKQKIPAYSNNAFIISLGAKEYADLGKKLSEISSQSQITDSQIINLLEFVNPGEAKTPPSPIVDAQLKMILLSTALLTSPNYSGPPFELLIARYYVNELNFSTKEIAAALREKDVARAHAAWDYGHDSWNSYFTIVNKAIVPKVGDKFTQL